MNNQLRSPRILIFRRENIGDLVCTTPLIHALRDRFPTAYIACLVNIYNADILEGNPDVDRVYAYRQNRHSALDPSLPRQWWERIRTFIDGRHDRFDYVILATLRFHKRDLRLARALGARHVVAFAGSKNPALRNTDFAVNREEADTLHIVEELAALAQPFDIATPPPPLRVYPNPDAVAAIRRTLTAQAPAAKHALIGVHISSRYALQRWLAESFIALIQKLHAQRNCSFMLFWSPGDENNPLHPGDDQKAAAIMAGVKGLPVLAHPTQTLRELVAGLALCDSVICSDGGAMHIAAGLGKPIVCFFGNSVATRWHPWGVPYVLLQPESHMVKDTTVDQAVAAYEQLCC